MKISFKITKEMVILFSELTGDKNSLHLDEEFARRFRYRKPTVHGMLPFSFISLIQRNFSDKKIVFSEVSVQFLSPIFIGNEITLLIQYCENEQGNYDFDAVWSRYGTNDELIRGSGKFCLVEKYKTKNNVSGLRKQKCFIHDKLVENTYTINDIHNKTDSFSFHVCPDLSAKYSNMLLGALIENNTRDKFDLDPNLITIFLLSTLSGMKLPGRYSTTSDFSISFNKPINCNNHFLLKGLVEKSFKKSEKIKLHISIFSEGEKYSDGKMNILINPVPPKLITCKEIKNKYMALDLEGKVVMVTGASRGIGAATAKLFAMHGAKVAVNYFKGKNDAESIVKDINSAGGEALALQCDIKDSLQVRQTVLEISKQLGSVDILVNNAVNDFFPKDILKLEWNDYLEELEVSLKGMHNCCKEAIQIFKQKKRGKIIALSSTFVDTPIPGQNKYITIKSSITGYIRSLATDLAGYNIQANIVEPNMTDTDLLSSIPPGLMKKMIEEREFGRNLYPIEVAQSIVFLASKWADTISGQRIVLNLGEAPFL